MKNYLILSLVVLLSLVGAVVLAQEDVEVSQTDEEQVILLFPIEELGGCATKEECREYCAQEENKEACVTYAETHNLLPRQSIQKFREHKERVRAVLEGQSGPGGCTSVRECRVYCTAEGNRDECLEFGLDNGLLPPQAAEQAKRIIALRTTGGPGGCSTPAECRVYCSDELNHEECLAFAEQHGLISDDQRARIEERRQKIEERLQQRTGPGGCTSREECRLYCEDPEHAQECVTFGQAEGLIDRQRAERTLRMLRDGEFEEYRARFEGRREEFERRIEEARLRHSGLRTELRQRLENIDDFEGTLEQRLRLREGLESRDTRVRTQYEQRLRDGSTELRYRYEERLQNNEDATTSNSGSGSIIQFLTSLFAL